MSGDGLSYDPPPIDYGQLALDSIREAGLKVSVESMLRHVAELAGTDMAKIDALKNHIVWMAQTTHQAHHQDIAGTWHDDCPRDVCASTRAVMLELFG